jgi:hypothetical protein
MTCWHLDTLIDLRTPTVVFLETSKACNRLPRNYADVLRHRVAAVLKKDARS